MDFPTPTPLYDAIAAALRPHVGADERLALTFPVVVARAAEAAQSVVGTQYSEVATLVTERRRLVEDAKSEVERQAGATARATADAVQVVTDTATEMARQRAELARRNERTAVLEGFYVLARARWDYEGAPPVLRQAIEAVEATL